MHWAYHQALLRAHRGGMPTEELGKQTASVAGLMIHAGRYDHTVALCFWAYGPAKHQLGEAHPVVVALASNMALALQFKGDLQGAAQLQQRLLELAETRTGDGIERHAELYAAAVVMGNLALTMREAGDYDVAENYGREALRVVEHYFGPDDLRTAAPLNNLGLFLLSSGKFAEAEHVFERALSVRRAKPGARHPMAAYTLTSLGSLYLAMGRPTEAAGVFREALVIREDALGSRHPEPATMMNELATACHALGDRDEAMTAFTEEEAICRRLGRHEDVAISLFNQADTLLRGLDDPAAARVQLAEGMRVLASIRARPELLNFSERLRRRIDEQLTVCTDIVANHFCTVGARTVCQRPGRTAKAVSYVASSGTMTQPFGSKNRGMSGSARPTANGSMYARVVRSHS